MHALCNIIHSFQNVVHTLNLLLLFSVHKLTAASKSNKSRLGRSEDKRINMSNVVVLSRFLESVFILFMVEKPLSQLAVEIGRVASLDRVG